MNGSPAELGAERGPVETEQLGGSGAVAAGGSDDLLHKRGFDEIDERFVERAGVRGAGGEGGGIRVAGNLLASTFHQIIMA